MALRNTMNTLSGLPIAVAYTRVESITVDPKNSARFNAMTYNTSPEVNPVVAVVSQLSCEVNPDLPLHSQLYEFLKTQEAWADAVDC